CLIDLRKDILNITISPLLLSIIQTPCKRKLVYHFFKNQIKKKCFIHTIQSKNIMTTDLTDRRGIRK
ncbi:hypothetical protein, partial [Ignavibacterium sp.]|uniref:hypothetical protein n=1 Tax=Ignavibacterium sp. TaxID=2651167 RepID=UPI0025BC0499